jgi:hypothetical protein
MGLTSAQMGAVQRLIETAPDVLLMRLNAALSAARVTDPVFIPVSDLARIEAADRRARDIVMEPLKGLADPTLEPPQQPMLQKSDIARLWRLMKALEPEMTAAAAKAALALRAGAEPPPEFNMLCLAVAAALGQPEPEVGPGAEAALWPLAERLRLTRLLQLTPVLRSALVKLPNWARSPSGENMAAVRLSFKDAIAVAEDAGPVYMEALLCHLQEPHQILRLISAVMDRPSDRYLAASELADIGERLLADVGRRVLAVSRFDPYRGAEGGAEQAASVMVASAAIRTFEEALALSREAPWGAKVAAYKQALAQSAETRLREAEPAVAAALPLQAQRALGSIAPRPGPRVDGYPDDGLVRKAEGLLSFLEETRNSAANAGFGSLRAKVIESLEIRLDHYVEDLVERLRDDERQDVEWTRAYLEVAADFSGMVRGPQAAQIVRRRAAAA